MMKYIFILFPVLLIAQPNKDILLFQKYPNGTGLNGTSQYWTVNSPLNVDLNGPELIVAATDRNFETSVGSWIGVGTTTITRVDTQKLGGVWSGYIAQTSTGSSANCAQLDNPYGTVGLKYTIEVWARLSYGNTSLRIDAGGTTSTTTINSTGWTKCVLNSQFDASGRRPRVYLLGAGAVYIDSISVTLAYDMMRVAVVRGTSGTYPYSMDNSIGSFSLAVVGAGTFRSILSDGTNTINLTESGTARGYDGRYHVIVETVNRTGARSLYIDGIPANTADAITTLGVMRFGRITIGALGSASFFGGNIGEFQVVRYSALPSDISVIVSIIGANYKRSLPTSYSSGTIVAWYDWANSGTDRSGNGNNLTSTGSPVIVKVK